MNNYNANAAAGNGDILNSMDALLKRSENILDTIQNAKNQSDNDDVLKSLDALEQRAAKMHNEIQSQNTIAGQSDPAAMTEGEIDDFIKDLNSYVDLPSAQTVKRHTAPIAKPPADSYAPVAANENRPGGGLPAFPDVSIFDPPRVKKRLPKIDLRPLREKQLSKRLFKLPHLILYGFVIVLIIFSVLVSINQASETPLFGYRFYNVISNSMDGMINKGSLVLVQDIPCGDLAAGDVITFKTNEVNSKPITHQIVAVVDEQADARSFITKGYNNSVNDPSPVQPDMVLGKVVFHLPIAGVILDFIGKFIFLIIVILLVGAAAYLLFFMPGKEKKAQPEASNDREDQQEHKKIKEHFVIEDKSAIPKKPVEDYQITAPPVSANKGEIITHILKNLQGILFVDSKKELEEKVERLLESRHQRIYSDLQNAVVKINHDQSDILKELDGLIGR